MNLRLRCNAVWVPDDYFDPQMVRRQRLVWAIATRRQLERWEPLVAAFLHGQFGGPAFAKSDIWLAQIEHHFALVSARHLLWALDLDPPSEVSIESTVRAELKEGRDLQEHWVENLPVFSVRGPKGRLTEPRHRSGRDFAARNPRAGAWPYWWLGWALETGPRLMPHVSATDVHRLLDAVEAEVLAADDELRRFLPARAQSHWVEVNGEWWPTAMVTQA